MVGWPCKRIAPIRHAGPERGRTLAPARTLQVRRPGTSLRSGAGPRCAKCTLRRLAGVGDKVFPYIEECAQVGLPLCEIPFADVAGIRGGAIVSAAPKQVSLWSGNHYLTRAQFGDIGKK
jgi:hypothetical protein